MLGLIEARDRAFRYSIETGHMPDINLIHARQRLEGFDPCFGRAIGGCDAIQCRWHSDCVPLASYKPSRRLYSPATEVVARSIPLEVAAIPEEAPGVVRTPPQRKPTIVGQTKKRRAPGKV